MALLHREYIDLAKRQLGTRRNIAKALVYLEDAPEVIDVHIGELNAAINLFDRYRRSEGLRQPEYFPNTESLIRILGNDNLPEWQEIQQKLISSHSENRSAEFNEIFAEIGTFEFPDTHDLTPLETLGTLFVSLYRTYTLATRPHLRQAGAMVGSTIAEMLSLLAINGCKTHLFLAEKVWILYHEKDSEEKGGFSRTLAQKIRTVE